MRNLFDGPGAGLVGKIMASRNAAAEVEAVERLASSPAAHVLVIGFGPGVGVELLAKRLSAGFVLGVDPSRAMLRQASARNRAWIAAGRVRLERARADQVPAADGAFDGAIAVNALMLCEPAADAARELARVLKPGAGFVSITHDWAAAKHAASPEAWAERMVDEFVRAGFCEASHFRADAEQGRAIAVVARRA